MKSKQDFVTNLTDKSYNSMINLLTICICTAMRGSGDFIEISSMYDQIREGDKLQHKQDLDYKQIDGQRGKQTDKL